MKAPHERNVILVTGGAGYLGSQLVRDLAQDERFRDCRIRIYDNLQRHHVSGLLDLPSSGRFEFVEGDVLDRLNMKRAMTDARAVVHLAAIVRTPLSFDHPSWTEQVNHWGSASVVDCAAHAGVPHLLYASSAVVYGPGGPFTEAEECQPIGPYAVSKWHAEREFLQARERGIEAGVIRFGTIFGNAPAMRFDAVANRFVFLCSVGRPLVVHGSGEQMRPLIHVCDASAILRDRLADPGGAPPLLNAAAFNLTILEVAEALQAVRPDARIRYTDQGILTEISFSVDTSLLAATGFRAGYSLERGLSEMLARWRGLYPLPTETAAGA